MSAPPTGSGLRRSTAAAPVRIVHLGLGAFARSHQAWYTDAAGGGEWGIAGFTGRSPAAAEALTAQDGLYHVLVRGSESDEAQLVTSLAAARDGADTARLNAAIAAPTTAVVTLTVTEAGYRTGPDGRPDPAATEVWDDLARLQRGVDTGYTTVPGRLLAALDARRRADAGPLALVPCDNIADNGAVLARLLRELAERVGAPLRAWLDEQVAFVDTSVDRITPATTAADEAVVRTLTGTDDRAPVVTEPFRDWVLCGRFPAGRPAWEEAGATIVDDLRPYERRKLWLLNGAHSLLAYRGLLTGPTTVAAAVRDAPLRQRVEAFWDEAERHLGGPGQPDLDLPRYRRDLASRFENPRIEHRLRQIAAEGSAKVRLRAVPVALAERRAGRSGSAALGTVAAWIAYVRTADDLVDAAATPLRQAAARPLDEAVHRLVALLSEDLAADPGAVDDIREQTDELLAVHATR